MYSNLIVVLVAIILVISNAAEVKNSKTALRTLAATNSGTVVTCESGAATVYENYVFGACYLTSGATSAKTTYTENTFTTTSYVNLNCGGSGTSESQTATIGTSCPSGALSYYGMVSDATSISAPANTGGAAYYSQAECKGDMIYYSYFKSTTTTCIASSTCISNVGAIVSCDDDDDSTCFAGSETVTMESGDMKMISDVIVGDRVLASDVNGKTSFSDVISVPHGTNNIETSFTQIFTSSGNDIKMTANHLLPSGVCGEELSLTKASNVEVGSCIQSVKGQEQVTSTNVVSGKGIYTIVTNEEYVVVNGIIASPFAGNHALGNAYYNIYRSLYAVSPALFASSWFAKAHIAFSDFLMTVSP